MEMLFLYFLEYNACSSNYCDVFFFKLDLYRPEGGPAQMYVRLSICTSVLLCQLGVFAITIMRLDYFGIPPTYRMNHWL
jgi:hypothetical protein